MKRYQYQLLCLLAIIFYASDPIIAKLGLDKISLFWFLGLSQAIAAITVCLVYGLLTEIKLFLRSSRKTKFFLILISITNSIIGPMLFLTGVNATSGINATLIGRTEGIITAVLGIRLLGERKLYQKFIGMGIALIGIIIISS
jgi:drug/metabolite transporter (DMT)-like permease